MLDGLAGRRRLALAVSGGADSVALMHLVARWRARPGAPQPEVTVLTVDHALRAGSGAEAEHVGRLARVLGFGHLSLRWNAAKPGSNLQAAAREARYDLMAAHCHAHGIPAMVTAHHLQDQAETVLMRLGRGSGVDGLAGMPQVGAWAGITVLRPLLDLPKARLTATLEQAGVRWIEDPSNRDGRFERVRTRRAMATLETLGVSAERLALTARRMRRAREALDNTTEGFLAANLELGDAGYARIRVAQLGAAPREIALRAFMRLLAAIGGSQVPPRLARVERLFAALATGGDGAGTLSGCRVAAKHGVVTFVRESGRKGLPELQLAPGETGLWDRRFRVHVPGDGQGPVVVRALTRAGYARLRARLREPVALPPHVPDGLASFWRDGEILSVPHLRYQAASLPREGCTAEFVNRQVLGLHAAQELPIRTPRGRVTKSCELARHNG